MPDGKGEAPPTDLTQPSDQYTIVESGNVITQQQGHDMIVEDQHDHAWSN